MSGGTSSANFEPPSRMVGIYKIEKEIGKGSFATVYKCVNKNTNGPVAIKSVIRSKLKSKKLIENLEIEISILKSMKHPHIVGLLDYNQTLSHFHLVMDYCSMGDLSYFIRKRNVLIKTHPVISSLLERYPSPEGSHGLNEILVIHFLKQLASALEFLRSKSLVHRDIKPQNLLLCPPMHSKQDFIANGYVGLWELPILKIADFGFARFLPSTSMAETLCGSPLYMAPEILRYEKYNAKADLWSVGAVLYEMTVGKPPFRADNHVQLLKNIERSNDRIKFPSAAQVPDSLKKLIRSLLKYNPTERVSFTEFFNDPLIIDELEGNDEPLETSQMDENLFISEYISPIKNPNVVAPLTAARDADAVKEDIKEASGKGRQQKEALYKKPENFSGSNNVAIVRANTKSLERDEEIRKIINKSSPGPETLSNSLQGRKLKENSLILRNADNDIILEKDYVVVEKRAVEVNAIADELAHAGSGALAINPSKPSLSDSAREKKEDEVLQNPNVVFYRRGSLRSNSLTGQRRPTMSDRRISISISPTNALSKAIGLASNRLFGANDSPQSANPQALEKRKDDNQTYKENAEIISSESFANNSLLQRLSTSNANWIHSEDSNQNSNSSPHEITLNKLKSIAIKAHAINLFADVKFSQLIPSPPSCNESDDEMFLQNDSLPPKMVKLISEEGVALYVKTLSLLAKGMAIASEWWYANYELENSSAINETSMRKLSMNSNNSDEGYGANNIGKNGMNRIEVSVRINELVQWIRDKFNESLEKANFIKLRLQEADKLLKQERSIESSTLQANSSVGTRIIAEKLIFDRALEMSRTAAINELVKEDLKGCQLSYSTAIWMLEALLEGDSSVEDDVLDENDKIMIEKFIMSIGNRLSVLKKKLEINQ